MKEWQYHAHTADIRLKVKADSLEELLEAALEGMSGILSEDLCRHSREFPLTIEVEVNAQDATSLLIDFLSEVLTLSHIHRAIFCRLQVEKLSSQYLIGKIHGQNVSEFDDDIKAVTYHEAEVIENLDGTWYTNIIFDI